MSPLHVLLESCVRDAGAPPGLAASLAERCPWLDGTDAVSEEMALHLLGEAFSGFSLGGPDIERFIAVYNTRVSGGPNPVRSVRESAYESCLHALAPYGEDDAFDEGDYWVSSESFAGPTPSITVHDGFRFPPAALAALKRLAVQYADHYTEFRIQDAKGDTVFVASAK